MRKLVAVILCLAASMAAAVTATRLDKASSFPAALLGLAAVLFVSANLLLFWRR